MQLLRHLSARCALHAMVFAATAIDRLYPMVKGYRVQNTLI